MPASVFLLTCVLFELQDVFGKAGMVAKLVLPETKTLAVVEFQKPSEARHAFKALAFKRFQTAPLFLEWAPKDIFSGNASLVSLQVSSPRRSMMP